MQIAGASGSVTDMTSVPVRMPETPTEKIYDRRHSYDRRQTDRRHRPTSASADASDLTPAPTPLLSARALLGLGLIVFTCGALFATAVYRLRPRAVVARAVPVERVAPAPSVVEIQPLPKPAPEPVLAAPAPALPAPVAPPAAAVAVEKAQPPPVVRAAEPRVVPASAKPVPAIRARPAPVVRPKTKRPAQASETRVAAPSSIDTDPFAPPARPSKKWVDPFAE